jgi:hypothetical protein
MPFPAEKSYNPPVSKTPILGPSSGNPKSFQDPNSVASIGNTIQSMADQAQADTLYDAPPPKKEAFRNEIYNPLILKRKDICNDYNPWVARKEGFHDTGKSTIVAVLVILGLSALMLSFGAKKNK